MERRIVMKDIKLKDILIFTGIITVILLLVFRGKDKQVFEVSPVKEIETRVEGKETEIRTIERRIGNENKIINAITSELNLLKADLANFKHQRDTISIVQIQDTIITKLEAENSHLNNVILGKDSIITAQRFIINSKDTLIAVLEHDGKKYKKQRNLSLLFNGILTGVAIIK